MIGPFKLPVDRETKDLGIARVFESHSVDVNLAGKLMLCRNRKKDGLLR